MEVIDVIEAFDLPYNDGAALKYLLRWRHKGGTEDLRKCRWYIERMIANAEADRAVESSGSAPQELSRTCGQRGEDSEPVVTTVYRSGDLSSTREIRQPTVSAYVHDPRD
jgi:hypothetical protein